MKFRPNPPSPRAFALISAIAAIIFFLLMVLLLRHGHSDVSTAQGVAVPPNNDATVGARGILSALFAFVFGILALVSAISCVVFLRQRNQHSDEQPEE